MTPLPRKNAGKRGQPPARQYLPWLTNLTSPEDERRAPGHCQIPVDFRGSTRHFSVYTDREVGAHGEVVAAGVLANCEEDYRALSFCFGGLRPDHFNVILTTGIDGAFHIKTTGSDLYCDVSSNNADFSSMLVVAEAAEVFASLQNAGWDAESSNGEGLSRALAADLYPTEVRIFRCVPCWLDGNEKRKNYVDRNDPTDKNPQSVGCAVLFLHYLRFQLQFSWQAIVQAAGPTLADVYRNLTGLSDAWESFRTLIEAHFPKNQPSRLRKDNPFPVRQASSRRPGPIPGARISTLAPHARLKRGFREP